MRTRVPFCVLVPLALLAINPSAQVPGDGTVFAHAKISSLEGGFVGPIDNADRFGSAAACVGDLDGDGLPEVAVSVPSDDDGGIDHGGLFILFLEPDGSVRREQKISSLEGEFDGQLDSLDFFGRSLASLGDLNGDGSLELVVGATGDDDGGPQRGAVWILFLDVDGTVRFDRKLSSTSGLFDGELEDGDGFGRSLAVLGDLDLDGNPDLAVGAPGDDDGGHLHGAVWILFLNSDGSVREHQKISDTEGGFDGVLDEVDSFGHALAPLGDLDGDGVVDVACGAPADDDVENGGAVWILFLNRDGTVREHQKISGVQGDFDGDLDPGDNLGSAMARLDDVDGDGVTDLAVSAIGDDDGGEGAFSERGAVWILFLRPDGTVKGYQKVSDTEGGFVGELDDMDVFGTALASLGDFDGDGVEDLLVGASDDGDGGFRRGAVWTLLLDCRDAFVATETVRLGTPANVNAFLPGASGPPVSGEVWEPSILSFLPSSQFAFVMYSQAPANLVTPWGTLLCTLPPDDVFQLPADMTDGITTFSILVPYDCNLFGLEVYMQGALLAGGESPVLELTNAIDLAFGVD